MIIIIIMELEFAVLVVRERCVYVVWVLMESFEEGRCGHNGPAVYYWAIWCLHTGSRGPSAYNFILFLNSH